MGNPTTKTFLRMFIRSSQEDKKVQVAHTSLEMTNIEGNKKSSGNLFDVPAAHGVYYGYSFGASGSSIHHELHKHAGKRVNGSLLWVIEISDKPGQREAEPAFKIGRPSGKSY